MEFSATGLARSFGKHAAVVHADVELKPGRVTGLVGPNGAGKTTLLLMLAGLLAPDEGTIRLDGQETTPEELRARIGWMPDVFGTWDSLTAAEILTTFGRLYGLQRKQAAERATELLETVHLAEHATKPAHELSRGQKQRLGLARALVHRPAVLLLDEPASGMDPRSRAELRELLRALAADGCAICISSHILPELAEMVDDVVVMIGGRTRQADTAAVSHSAVAAEPWRSWRIRRVGQSAREAEVREFRDDEAAADHLAALLADGAQIAEFARTTSDLEDTYRALDADRT